METNKKVGILGYGEIGKAIASFYENPFIQDLDGQNIPDDVQLDILHICIPYQNEAQFQSAVKTAIHKWGQGALVFNHSTVPVGTTAEIAKVHPHIVHTPVRGVHPHLAEGVATFTKYIGADDSGVGRLASEELEGVGMHTMVLFKSQTSELLKLLDTTYYGLCIAYHAYAEKLCLENDVNFEMVMTEGNTSYNEGYTKLGKANVVRPVLFAPSQTGGKIGGHCIIPNANILKNQFGDDAILEAILRHS